MNSNRQVNRARMFAMNKASVARVNLAVVVFLTALNMILAICGSDTMFLFSATMPYAFVLFGITSPFMAAAVIYITLAVVLWILYLLCCLLSKVHYSFMVIALVLFGIDTLYMVVFYLSIGYFPGLVDMVFHGLVLYYLITGVINSYRAKQLPASTPVSVNAASDGEEHSEIADTPILRAADTNVKFRVRLQCNFGDHLIQYRRVKRVNELVVDGQVYDDVEMFMETAHVLSAVVDGHDIVAQFDGVRIHIYVDGEQLAKKVCWF